MSLLFKKEPDFKESEIDLNNFGFYSYNWFLNFIHLCIDKSGPFKETKAR